MLAVVQKMSDFIQVVLVCCTFTLPPVTMYSKYNETRISIF